MHLLWWWWTDWQLRRAKRPWTRYAWWGVAAYALAIIACIGIVFTGARPAVPMSVTYLWLLIILPLTIAIITVGSVLYYSYCGVRRLTNRPASVEEAAVPAEGVSSRRGFLAGLAVAPPLVTLAGAGIGYSRLDDFRVLRQSVSLASLPPALRGLKIAHVSDTHVGTFTHGRVLTKIVDEVNATGADLVLFTGDLINREISDMPAAAEMFRGLRARHGVMAVEGNHDLFEGTNAFHRACDVGGVDLLIGENRQLTINGEKVDLLGMQWGGRSPEAHRQAFDALPPVRDGAFPILLGHHPHVFDYARERGIPLTLAGHTHGGQLMLPGDLGFGPLMYKYWSGLYEQDQFVANISNGAGNWFPLRTNAPAEITLLTLT